MANITIRNIEDELKKHLRTRSTQHGHSMEEKARTSLRRAVDGVSGSEMIEFSGKLFGKTHCVDIEQPSRNF